MTFISRPFKIVPVASSHFGIQTIKALSSIQAGFSEDLQMRRINDCLDVLHDPYNTGFDRGEYLALRKVAAILYKNFGIVPSKTSWFRTVERSEACMLQPKKFQKLYPCDFEHPPSNWPVNDAHKRVALPKEYLYQGEQNDT